MATGRLRPTLACEKLPDVPSVIQLVGGSSIMVGEDAEAVVQWLDRETAVFVRLTRMSMHDEPDTLDGQPVYIRTVQVASVSPSG